MNRMSHMRRLTTSALLLSCFGVFQFTVGCTAQSETASAPAKTLVPEPVKASANMEPAELAKPGASVTYNVHHALTIKDIPADSKQVRVWFWIPNDDDAQKVLDFTVASVPAGSRVTRDPAQGSRLLFAEVNHPTGPVSLQTDFLIRRTELVMAIDPAKAGALTDVHRQLLAEELRKDVPHMQVSDELQRVADEVCGAEANVVIQARKLGQWVVENSDHYSIANAPKSSGQGDAAYCMVNKGGGCTDQHALFIALARARGIPTRLHFGTLLKPQNQGKEMDPGYRCWLQYFVPNYGWIPMDLSAADTNADKRDFYYTSLDNRRIRFWEGRDLELSPKHAADRLNLFVIAYVEIDGKQHKAFDRILKYTEVPDGPVARTDGGQQNPSAVATVTSHR